MFDFPRLQILVLLILAIGGGVFFIKQFSTLHLFLMLGATVALSIQVYYIFPYLPFVSKEVKKTAPNKLDIQFSLMVSNVQMKNEKTAKLLHLVQKIKPDILLVIETNEKWEKSLKPLEQEYKHIVKYPLENTYGMILYSNVIIDNVEIKFLIQNDVPSIHAHLRIDDKPFKISCLHPRPPAPGEAKTSKPRDKELMLVSKKIKVDPYPSIVLGDLNDVAWSDTSRAFQKATKLLDPRKGRGFYNTFNANIPILRWALDHIFFSKEFKLLEIKRLSHVGSDHFPIYIELGM